MPGFLDVSAVCLNTAVEQAGLPPIPEQCRARHPWGPGLVTIDWEPCDCPPARKARGGHLTVRCGQAGCEETWLAPLHKREDMKILGHHRPGYR
jgi:hypothetical protein